MKTNICRSRST